MKAFILAAGYGKRLLPLTLNTPKPAIKVAGMSLLLRLVLHLKNSGITEFVINCHWLADQLIKEYGDGHQWGVNIQWVREKTLLETGGGLLNALPLLGNDTFLLHNTDVFADIDYQQFLTQSTQVDGAHLLLVNNPSHNPYGDYGLIDNAQVVQLTSANNQQSVWTYSGISLVNPKCLLHYPNNPSVFPLSHIFDFLIENELLSASTHSGTWFDIGTIERLDAFHQYIKS